MTSNDQYGSPIRLVIVADVRLYREGLASTLCTYANLAIVGTAANRVDATLTVSDLVPDVVVIDVAIAGAFDLIRDLRVRMPATRLIAFAVDGHIATIVQCAEAGATSYVNLDASIEELVKAIELAATGELACSPRVAAQLFRCLENRAVPNKPSHQYLGELLTSREHEVLAFVTQGLSNKEIASTLKIAEATVKNHVHHILDKLHVGSRGQAAASIASLPDRRRNLSESPELRTRRTG